MTDQTIPADKVREIIHVNTFRGVVMPHCRASIIDQLEALLPPPPRPTLAEMTNEQRRACRWMLCDVKNVEDRAIIVDPCREDGTARVVWPGALNEPPIDWEKVTPRPDVARMEWPGEQQPAPAPALPEGWRLADHEVYGRVVVTSATPSLDGRVYFVFHDVDDDMGYDWDFCPASDLTHLGLEADQ